MDKRLINPRDVWVESERNVGQHYEFAWATLRRSGRENGDAVGFSKDGKAAIVCDGMNGLNHARLFAQTAASMAVKELDNGGSAAQAIESASYASEKLSKLITGLHGGSAGLVVRDKEDGVLEWCGRGDVTLWLFGTGGITRLSEPHARGGALTSYIGQDPAKCSPVTFDGRLVLDRKCTIAVMTDGLWKYCDFDMLSDIFLNHNQLEDKAVLAVENAFDWITPDDASILLLETTH